MVSALPVGAAIPATVVDRVVACVRQAAAAIAEQQERRGRESTLKADGSPVTACDTAAERVVLDALAAIDPAVPIVSEETDRPPFSERQQWTRFWLVDPLDGTKEFIAGLPDWTINVALVEAGAPVLGVVLAPARGLLYYAARGLGAWRVEGDGPPVRIQTCPPAPGAPLRVVESRSHRSAALDAFLSRLDISERVSIGSSLKLCWVADGRADLYARFTPVMEWDVAAADCVFRYATSDSVPNRSPLCYNTPDLRIEKFVIGFPPVETSPGTGTPAPGAE